MSRRYNDQWATQKVALGSGSSNAIWFQGFKRGRLVASMQIELAAENAHFLRRRKLAQIEWAIWIIDAQATAAAHAQAAYW